MAALSGINSSSIKYLINTPWQYNHANGNEWINNEGATIISFVTTKEV